MALLSGTQGLQGMQWMGDRSGWLRALSRPGAAGWSEDDLVCRTDPNAKASADPAADGLGALIARRFVKGGFVY